MYIFRNCLNPLWFWCNCVSLSVLFSTFRSPKWSLFLRMTFCLLQLPKLKPNLCNPAALSLKKAACPNLAAVIHMPHATAASSTPSASAVEQDRMRRRPKEHKHTKQRHRNTHNRPITKYHQPHFHDVFKWLSDAINAIMSIIACWDKISADRAFFSSSENEICLAFSPTVQCR